MIDPFTSRNSAFAIPHGGDERMEKLIEFRETLRRGIPTGESRIPNQSPFDNRPSALACPANGKRDLKSKNAVPRSRERERVVADRVRVVGRKHTSSDGPGQISHKKSQRSQRSTGCFVRSFAAGPFRIRDSELRNSKARRELLTQLLKLQEEVGHGEIPHDECRTTQALPLRLDRGEGRGEVSNPASLRIRHSAFPLSAPTPCAGRWPRWMNWVAGSIAKATCRRLRTWLTTEEACHSKQRSWT